MNEHSRLSINFEDIAHASLDFFYDGDPKHELLVKKVLLSSLIVRMFTLMKNRGLATELYSEMVMFNPREKATSVQAFLDLNNLSYSVGRERLKRGFNMTLEVTDDFHNLQLHPYGFGIFGKDIEQYSANACLYSQAFLDASLKSLKDRSALNLVAFNTVHNAMELHPLSPADAVELTEEMCRPSTQR